jgi:Putative transposase of IS4/5 family (DUF4096)
VPEVRRLLQAPPAAPALLARRLGWSRWRRAHQAAARRCHRTRRGRVGPPAEPALAVVAVPGTPALSEAGWARVAPLLPGNGRRGGQWRGHRALLAGILWVMHTGASWRDLPAPFGAWQTAYDRYTRWRRDGTWGRILAALVPPEAATDT